MKNHIFPNFIVVHIKNTVKVSDWNKVMNLLNKKLSDKTKNRLITFTNVMTVLFSTLINHIIESVFVLWRLLFHCCYLQSLSMWVLQPAAGQRWIMCKEECYSTWKWIIPLECVSSSIQSITWLSDFNDIRVTMSTFYQLMSQLLLLQLQFLKTPPSDSMNWWLCFIHTTVYELDTNPLLTSSQDTIWFRFDSMRKELEGEVQKWKKKDCVATQISDPTFSKIIIKKKIYSYVLKSLRKKDPPFLPSLTFLKWCF